MTFKASQLLLLLADESPSFELETGPLSKSALRSNKGKRHRRSVTFNPEVDVYDTIHQSDMTEKEKSAYWLTRVDFHTIKCTFAPLVRMMSCGREPPEDDDEYCTRGLEIRTTHGSRSRELNKLRARAAVLCEQDRQMRLGQKDPEVVARIYQHFSEHCRAAARNLGMQDEEEAFKEVLLETSSVSSSEGSEGSTMDVSEESSSKKKTNRLTRLFRTHKKRGHCAKSITGVWI